LEKKNNTVKFVNLEKTCCSSDMIEWISELAASERQVEWVMESRFPEVDQDDKALEGAALQTMVDAMEEAVASSSHDLKAVAETFKADTPETGMLRKLIAELQKAKLAKAGDVQALKQQLLSMAGGNSNSAELREFAGQFKNIFDEQFIGARLPPAQGLATRDIVAKQNKEFHMTAKEMGAALLADWRKASKDAGSHDEAFDRKLEETAGMLVYPQSQGRLSITGHLWAHLTNMYMLVVRSLKELIDKTTLTWNLGDTTSEGLGTFARRLAARKRKTARRVAVSKGGFGAT